MLKEIFRPTKKKILWSVAGVFISFVMLALAGTSVHSDYSDIMPYIVLPFTWPYFLLGLLPQSLPRFVFGIGYILSITLIPYLWWYFLISLLGFAFRKKKDSTTTL